MLVYKVTLAHGREAIPFSGPLFDTVYIPGEMHVSYPAPYLAFATVEQAIQFAGPFNQIWTCYTREAYPMDRLALPRIIKGLSFDELTRWWAADLDLPTFSAPEGTLACPELQLIEPF